MSIFKLFSEISSNLQPYEKNDFRSDLLNIEKLIYKMSKKSEEDSDNSSSMSQTIDKKDNHANSKEIYQNIDKNLKLNVQLDGNGKVYKFIFQNLNNQEYATVSLMHGFSYFNVSVGGQTIEDKEQMNRLLKALDAKNLLASIEHQLTEQYKEKQKIIETTLVDDTLKSFLHVEHINATTQVKQEQSKQNSDIYFHIANLTIEKILKENQLSSSKDSFLNYDKTKEKSCLMTIIDFNSTQLSETINDTYIPTNINDTYIAVKLKRPNLGTAGHIQLQLEVFQQTEQSYRSIYDINNYIKTEDLLLNVNRNQNSTPILTMNATAKSRYANIDIQTPENNNKLLNAINAPDLLNQIKLSLLTDNEALDKKIAIKREECLKFNLQSKDLIENRIENLRKNLHSNHGNKNSLN